MDHHQEPQALPAAGTPADADTALVARARCGDGPAFEAIMRRYNRRLYRLARGLLKDDAEAEDVVQETFVTAYVKLASFQGPHGFGAWLSRIAANEALGRLRRRARLSPLDGDGAEEPQPDLDQLLVDSGRARPDPERLAAVHELRHVLEQAIDRLAPGFRAVFILRAVEGLTVAETAAALGLKPETVKTRFHRARARLHHTLDVQIATALNDVFPFAGARCDRVVTAVATRLGLRLPIPSAGGILERKE